MTIATAVPPARAILCHFDDYSTALFFARWPDRSLLWPGPVPDGEVRPGVAPPQPGADAESVRLAAVRQLGLNESEVEHIAGYEQYLVQGGTAVPVYLYRFRTFEAPTPAIEPAGGSFRQLPELRGSAPAELGLVREVFNLFVGGSGRR
ncbi:hypothetical protein [Pelomonas cellulosilytica]|uniref:Nudix hydrolase domain-containing protein n=1 Tax=Pelomonas cellulosilytica TaxID=2906762 RepID=A0ABS8XZW2_9BURK|nr:hypothetical protein [Pelomonas sp. P8]MCE4556833.1 hypothetical protein [Pelomonas sp. P8]